MKLRPWAPVKTGSIALQKFIYYNSFFLGLRRYIIFGLIFFSNIATKIVNIKIKNIHIKIEPLFLFSAIFQDTVVESYMYSCNLCVSVCISGYAHLRPVCPHVCARSPQPPILCRHREREPSRQLDQLLLFFLSFYKPCSSLKWLFFYSALNFSLSGNNGGLT